LELTSDIYKRIVTAKVFIDNNYQDDLNLDQISKQALLSRFHFHRLFRKVYKKTPHQYLTQKRLNKAKDLLSENKLVNDVCFDVVAPQYYRNMAYKKKMEQLAQPKKAIPHCFIENYKLDK